MDIFRRYEMNEMKKNVLRKFPISINYVFHILSLFKLLKVFSVPTHTFLPYEEANLFSKKVPSTTRSKAINKFQKHQT